MTAAPPPPAPSPPLPGRWARVRRWFDRLVAPFAAVFAAAAALLILCDPADPWGAGFWHREAVGTNVWRAPLTAEVEFSDPAGGGIDRTLALIVAGAPWDFDVPEGHSPLFSPRPRRAREWPAVGLAMSRYAHVGEPGRAQTVMYFSAHQRLLIGLPVSIAAVWWTVGWFGFWRHDAVRRPGRGDLLCRLVRPWVRLAAVVGLALLVGRWQAGEANGAFSLQPSAAFDGVRPAGDPAAGLLARVKWEAAPARRPARFPVAPSSNLFRPRNSPTRAPTRGVVFGWAPPAPPVRTGANHGVGAGGWLLGWGESRWAFPSGQVKRSLLLFVGPYWGLTAAGLWALWGAWSWRRDRRGRDAAVAVAP